MMHGNMNIKNPNTCLIHFLFRKVWNKEILYHHYSSTLL